MIRQEDQGIPPLDGLAYKPEKLIDTGSKMSDLLLAQDSHNRTVALKIACVDQRARADVNRLAIKNTIEWLNRLGHYRGIIGLRPIDFSDTPKWRTWLKQPIYSSTLQQWPGQPEFLVMEYIGGGSLRDFVGDKRLDIELALWIAHYIARALAYLHQYDCVHRDIKPENILFRELPQPGANRMNAIPLLIDFGVAARKGEDRLVSGSRLWMAPELQVAYEKRPLPVDSSWDVYALGLILCYMLTGRRPRHRNYDLQDYEAFREQTFVMLEREIPETNAAVSPSKARLKQLITDALAKTPDKRPTAQAFAAETAALLASLQAPLPAPELWRMQLEQSKSFSLANRRWLRFGAPLLLVLALLLLAGFAAQRNQFFLGFAIPAHEVTPPIELATATVVPDRAGSQSDTPATQVKPTQQTLTPDATTAPPTLAPLIPDAAGAAPTLVPFTEPTPVAPPTLVPFTATATLPTVSASTPALTPGLGKVNLLSPKTGVHANTPKVTFTWQISGQPLGAEQCFALVFWDANQPSDQHAPVAASKGTAMPVDFNLLAANRDSFLRRLTQTKQPFQWGVQIVSCAEPAKILKQVEQVRAYIYDGQ